MPTFARVRFEEVYPGVSVEYYGHQGGMEFDLIVAPHADPDRVRLRFPGAQELRLDGVGNLMVALAGGQVVLRAPVVYQEAGDCREVITAGYVLQDETDLGLELGSLRSRPAAGHRPGAGLLVLSGRERHRRGS